jgi:hypothetical protein
MISRIFVFGILYVAMFLGWIAVGLFMLFAPATFINFVRDNIAVLAEGPPGVRSKLFIRLIGAGLLAFAMRFMFRIAELSR